MGLFVETVLAIAKAERGYMEKASNANLGSLTGNAGQNNYTKYWRDLDPSFQGQPWCNAFVIWCMVQAYGVSGAKKLMCTDGGWSYYTPTSANYFKRKGQWSTTPQAGDVIFFKNATRIHHVGLVYKVDGSRVYTYEGNTSSGASVVANGGEVAAKSYALGNSAIAGYGRPKYDTATAPETFPTWIHSGAAWYYREAPGKNAHGWRDINGHRYYFDEKGKMATGWAEIGGAWYYFEPNNDRSVEGALWRSDSEGRQSVMKV